MPATAADKPASDHAHLFPATYRAPWTKQIRPFLTTLLLMLAAIFGRAHLERASSVWLWLFALTLLGLLLFGTLNAGRARVTLYDDRIEKRTWLGTKTWRRDGVGFVFPGSFGGFDLGHKHSRGYLLPIPAGIRRDAAWDAWLSHVPDAEMRPSLFRRLLP